jgi:hypothetical protein
MATIEEDAAWLTKVCAEFNVVKKLGDPHHMFSSTKQSPKSIADQMQAFGHHFVPAPVARNQADIAAQVEMVRTGLSKTLADGAPEIQVFDTCPCTIRGFQSWGYDRTAKGELKGGEDRFEDINDDEMDAVRMIIATNPCYTRGKVEIYDGGE